MDFKELLKKRKTTFEFSKKKVNDLKIVKIIDAGRLAPSSLNSQPWKFILIKNSEKIKSIMRTCSYGFFHSYPPVLIVLVWDPELTSKKNLLGVKLNDFIRSHKDLNIGAAMMSMIFAATNLKVDSAILSPKVAEVNKILRVKKPAEVSIVIGLGYEDKDAFRPKKERKKINDVLGCEEYFKRCE